MNLLDQAAALARFGRWGLALARPDTRCASPLPDNPKFVSPRDAVRRIPDGAVLAASGLGVHQRASILYWALRERFAETGHPRGLTVVNVGGHGSRGLLPGTLDELAQPRLCTRFITSHFETFHAVLALAAAGRCELQCIPLGVVARLFDSLQHGRDAVLTRIGVGTFLDPRIGRGSPVRPGRGEQLVTAEGDRLRYRMPPLDVAVFNAPAADRRGNLYATGCAMVGDSAEIARAAKRNRGLVIANVGRLVDEGHDRILLPGSLVDAVVCYPDTEQTAGFFHRDPWPAVTTAGGVPIGEGLAYAHFVRRLGELAGGLPARTAVDEAVYRLAAETLLAEVPRGGVVAIGAGHPEEVSRVVFEQGRLDDVTFLVESGVVGGLPAPGVYFGAAFSPRAILSTAQLFKRCERRLDAACLGALEVDAAGNVNVSRRGPGVRRYAGPGGFIDFTSAADALIFVAGWMRGGEIALDGGALRLRQRGRPKFVARVGEVTFNAAQALREGKRVYYATPVGLFRLTRRGVELCRVMPGIDVRRDVLEATPMRIVLPRSGRPEVIPAAVVTGEGFALPPCRGRAAA
ncbi:MAG TPA: malonate decarboxylase subunit alpha [Candidatus Dormibacteraeota bacterium]|nr:malonate decarboxylase subunit alpha [Candidatus Dormibacteraeota bacterium]